VSEYAAIIGLVLGGAAGLCIGFCAGVLYVPLRGQPDARGYQPRPGPSGLNPNPPPRQPGSLEPMPKAPWKDTQ
jgi:hypothetical protein